MVIFVLVFFSASFQNSVDSLVVLPLEHIMESLRNSASALLKSMKAMEEEEKEKEEDEESLITKIAPAWNAEPGQCLRVLSRSCRSFRKHCESETKENHGSL